MKLALKNKTQFEVSNTSKNTALENLITSGYKPQNLNLIMKQNETENYDVTLSTKNLPLIDNTSAANNHSLISNFIEIPCLNTIDTFSELLEYNHFEPIFSELIKDKNDTFLYSEFLKYITKNSKDYFLIFRYTKSENYVYNIETKKVELHTTISGINETYNNTTIETLSILELIEFKNQLIELRKKEIELSKLNNTQSVFVDIDLENDVNNENLQLMLIELEIETNEYYDLLRIYTIYISLSVGLYLDDKNTRNARKSAKRNNTASNETDDIISLKKVK